MRKVIKEGTKVKIKAREQLEELLDDNHRISGLYFDDDMFNYCGQELEVLNSWWSDYGDNRFMFENNTWTWNTNMIEEVSEESMKDLDRVCSDCGREIDEDEELTEVEHGNGHVCSNCLENYNTCYECGDYIHEDNLNRAYNGYNEEVYVCDDCLRDYYRQCDECGDYYPEESMHYEDYNYFCNNCYEENPRHLICGYHEYDRDFEFYKASGEENPPHYIGSELEMENNYIDSDVVRYIKDELNGITAHDGSLDGDGAMEWVDHPRTLLNHYEIADIKRDAFERLVKAGYRSNDTSTCGLHFHVSRPYQVEIDALKTKLWSLDCGTEEYKQVQEEISGLEEKQDQVIDRIILVMETYKEELIKFSRRKNTYWCQWLSDVVTTDNGKITSLDFIKKYKCESYGHHRALNLENHNTIEFRIFKGTLNFDTYMASLELVNNIVTLCKDLELPLEKITWNKLTSGQYVTKYVDEKDIHTNRKVVDTSEVDKIWNIIKNKKRAKILNKILKEFNNYYQYYIKKFDEIKNTENWSKICDTSGKLREYANTFEQVVMYKKNQDYDNLLYKITDMYNYNMYFEWDNQELQTIKDIIKDLLKEAREVR